MEGAGESVFQPTETANEKALSGNEFVELK